MQPLQNFCIPVVQPLCLCAVEIPEAEICQNARFFCRMGKVRAARQIGGKIPGLVRLEAVQADRDLAQRGRVEQRRLLLRQQCPVCRERRAEAELPADLQQLRQLRVQQRLAHDVQVQVLPIWPELRSQRAKVLRR